MASRDNVGVQVNETLSRVQAAAFEQIRDEPAGAFQAENGPTVRDPQRLITIMPGGNTVPTRAGSRLDVMDERSAPDAERAPDDELVRFIEPDGIVSRGPA